MYPPQVVCDPFVPQPYELGNSTPVNLCIKKTGHQAKLFKLRSHVTAFGKCFFFKTDIQTHCGHTPTNTDMDGVMLCLCASL